MQSQGIRYIMDQVVRLERGILQTMSSTSFRSQFSKSNENQRYHPSQVTRGNDIVCVWDGEGNVQ